MLRGDKHRFCLLASTAVVAIASIGCVAYGIVLVNQGSVQVRLAVQPAPSFATGLAIAVLILQTVLAAVGFFGALRKTRRSLLWFFKATMVFLALELALFVYVLMAGNGVFSENTAVLSETVEGDLTRFLIEEPETWKLFQDDKDCCGFNFRSTYNTADGGYPDLPVFETSQLFSGKACRGAGDDAIAALQQTFPKYTETAQEAANNDITLRAAGFRCYEDVVKIMRDFAKAGGIAIGILVLFNSLAFSFVSTLLFSIKEADGGLKPESSMVMLDSLASPGPKRSFFASSKKKQSQHAIIKFT